MKNAVPYSIETVRTIIRCWSPKDAAKMQKAIDASVDSLLPWLPWAKGEPKDFRSKIDTLRFFRGNFDLGNDFVYGIFDKNESEVLGGCGLHTRVGKYSLEIGYWINKRHQNSGFATEITRALIKTAFDLSDIDNIQINCDIKNEASLRVIDKVGFRKEGILLHKQKDANGDFEDLQISAILRDDYLRSDIRNDEIDVFDVMGELIVAQI